MKEKLSGEAQNARLTLLRVSPKASPPFLKTSPFNFFLLDLLKPNSTLIF